MQRHHDDYTIGWVCALPIEYAAAKSLLDGQRHPSLLVPESDTNVYTLGSIGEHNVVVSCLPKGQPGTNSAATVAIQMIRTFPSIKFCLLVGIGGGVPQGNVDDDQDVRLGDVVVGAPTSKYPGVVQWDLGKAEVGGFKRTGVLNKPPSYLLNVLSDWESDHLIGKTNLPGFLQSMKLTWPDLEKTLGTIEDILYPVDYTHETSPPSVSEISTLAHPVGDRSHHIETKMKPEHGCKYCQKQRCIRNTKPRDLPKIHQGLIASGNQVIKDAKVREYLRDIIDENILCVEMEAAGLVDSLPCLVIRGICDYADSHKNDGWHKYAAATAAAFAKDFLQLVQPQALVRERTALESIQNIVEDVRKIKTDTNQICNHFMTEEEGRILRWLTSLDFGSTQHHNQSLKQPGSCQWFLDSEQYTGWHQGKDSTLLSPGIPGAGKTILTSILVHNLSDRYMNRDDVGIAYIYCDAKEQDSQTEMELVSSLLKQLARQKSPIPSSVRELHEKHVRSGLRSSLSDVSEALKDVGGLYDRIYVLVDALDELSDTTRQGLTRAVRQFQDVSQANVFCTYRSSFDFRGLFNSCEVLKMETNMDDMMRYVDSRMGHISSILCDESKEKKVKRKLLEAADGMFLLVVLYLRLVRDAVNEKEIFSLLPQVSGKEGTDDAPREGNVALQAAYDSILDRIKSQNPSRVALARKVLTWVTFSKRPLSLSELQHAVSVDLNDEDLDRTKISPAYVMLSVCFGLVTVIENDFSEDDKAIRLVHPTTQEYMEQCTDLGSEAEQHRLMAVTCVTYLSFQSFKPKLAQIPEERFAVAFNMETSENRLDVRCRAMRRKLYGDMQAEFPLYDYSLRHWGQHTQSVNPGQLSLLNFSGRNYPQFLFATLWLASLPGSAGLDPSHYMRGITQYISLSRKSSVDKTGSYVSFPLICALHAGKDSFMCGLLRAGVDFGDKDHKGKTPLFHACGMGFSRTVLLLLTRGVYSKSSDCDGMTQSHGILHKQKPGAAFDPKDHTVSLAIICAAGVLESPLIAKLVNEGADLLARDGSDRTALMIAAKKGNIDAVQAFHKHGAQVDVQDSAGENSLHLAAPRWTSHYNLLLPWLLDHGVSINAISNKGQTPLMVAAGKGNLKAVQVFHEHGAEINFRDLRGDTPLHMAAVHSRPGLVSWLVKNGADFLARNNDGRTALMVATKEGNIDAVQSLHQGGAEINIRDSQGKTPLHLAVHDDRLGLVTWLLAHGACANTISNKGHTPLMEAVYRCLEGYRRTDIMDSLLSYGADSEQSNDQGLNPLVLAHVKGHQAAKNLLLAKGARVPKDMWGRTWVGEQVSQHHSEVVRMLLGKSQNISVQDHLWDSVLSNALQDKEQVPNLPRNSVDPTVLGSTLALQLVSAGKFEHARKLCQNKVGWDFDFNTYIGCFLFFTSVEKGQYQFIQWLLEHGVDPELQDNKGLYTALYFARKYGHAKVVEVLLDFDAKEEARAWFSPKWPGSTLYNHIWNRGKYHEYSGDRRLPSLAWNPQEVPEYYSKRVECNCSRNLRDTDRKKLELET